MYTVLAVMALQCICDITHGQNSDIYSSVAHLTDLVWGEQTILTAFDDYIKIEEDKLTYLKQMSTYLREVTKQTKTGGAAEYIEHPLNAFHTIRRFTAVWDTLLHSIAQNSNYQAFYQKIVESGTPWPSDVDYKGAMKALLRIQRVYNISTEDLMSGTIQGYSTFGLTASECFDIGKTATSIGEHSAAVKWIQTAIRDYYVPNSENTFNITDAYLALAEAYSSLDINSAVKTLEKLALEIDPSNRQHLNTIWEYRKMMNSVATQQPQPVQVVSSYQALCRGDVSQDMTYDYHGYCHYKKTAIPFLFAKQEILREDPYITFFHDVITENETNEMLKIAQPQLIRATVGFASNPEQSDIRISKVAWLWDTDTYNPIIKRISKRVELITGLSTTYSDIRSDAEPFQVVNYGIGGQYEPHYDYYEDKESLKDIPEHLVDTGDRIATFMFYLNDVKAGGATVFPGINVRIPPVKNGAAFWYNFKPSGESDPNTEHAGCPVLIGQKWVANKWIRERGQIFRRKCKLHFDTIETQS